MFRVLAKFGRFLLKFSRKKGWQAEKNDLPLLDSKTIQTTASRCLVWNRFSHMNLLMIVASGGDEEDETPGQAYSFIDEAFMRLGEAVPSA